MDLNPIYFAKIICIRIHLKSIIMDYIKLENHIKMDFFSLSLFRFIDTHTRPGGGGGGGGGRGGGVWGGGGNT